MNADRLLAHYEKIADAPDAILRLRRFILDLAVRGKLVEQDPNDEPASELLKRIAEEKARLVKAKRIKKSEVDPVNEEIAPFSVPSLWQWTRLGTIGDWGAGSTPPRGNSDLYGGGLTWLKSGELNDDTQLRGSEETITELAVQKGSFRINRPGDVLIAMYGATIGKLAILAEDAFTNQAVCGCTPFEGVFNKYLFLFLLSQRESFRAASEGGAQPNISKVKIVRRPFPLPPLAEQHRIVAKVDELMTLCDRLEAARTKRETTRDRLEAASLARLNAPDPDPAVFQNHATFTLDNLIPLTTRPDQIKALRQTILNLAVRGKLVEQDPNDEPASELLKRIAAEKARLVKAGVLRKQKPLPPINEKEVEFDLGEGWQLARMADVIKLWNGFAFKSGDFQSDGIPVIRIGDLQNGEVSLSDVVYVSDAISKSVRTEVWIPPNALLIAMSGATTGKTAFNRTGMPLLLNQRVGRIEVFSVSVNFIRFFFETTIARNLSISFGTAIPNLSTQQINETVIAIPPLAEQHRIVTKVDELMELCDQLEASLATGDDTRRCLLDALLHEALAPSEEESQQYNL